MRIRVLLIPVPPSNVTCGRAALAATAVEDDFLVERRLLEAVQFLELFPIQVQCPSKDGEWEINRRRNYALRHFIRLPYIDQIRILSRDL